jgi:hypothetical protein
MRGWARWIIAIFDLPYGASRPENPNLKPSRDRV